MQSMRDESDFMSCLSYWFDSYKCSSFCKSMWIETNNNMKSFHELQIFNNIEKRFRPDNDAFRFNSDEKRIPRIWVQLSTIFGYRTSAVHLFV